MKKKDVEIIENTAVGFCIINPEKFKENVRIYFINIRVKYPFAMYYRWLNDGIQIFFRGKWRNEDKENFTLLSDEKEIINYVFAGTHITQAIYMIDKLTDDELGFILEQCGYTKNHTRGEVISMVKYLALTHKFNVKGLKHSLLKK